MAPSGLVQNEKKYKVLALHGYTQNGQVFSQKTAVLRKELERIGIDLGTSLPIHCALDL